jgi:hypothetical protein
MSCVAPMAAPLAIVPQLESDAKTVNDLSTIICGGPKGLEVGAVGAIISSPAFRGRGGTQAEGLGG